MLGVISFQTFITVNYVSALAGLETGGRQGHGYKEGKHICKKKKKIIKCSAGEKLRFLTLPNCTLLIVCHLFILINEL